MKTILVILAAVTGIYMLHAWPVLKNQEDMLFIGAELSEERRKEVNMEWRDTEEIYMRTEDGETLHGWLQHGKITPAPLLIYFGGNAEEASAAIEQYDIPGSWSVLFVNYRGYGKSSGKPGEANLYNDAVALYDFVSSHDKVQKEYIAVMGRSMGTAPAAYLSAKRETAAAVLISPYDSRENLQKDRYPYLPVGTFIRHPFYVSSMASEAEAPLLGITASEDRVIPPDHSYKTFEKWGGETKRVEIEGHGHNSLHRSVNFQEEIHQFLRSEEPS